MENKGRIKTSGIVATVVGLIALGIALFQFLHGPIGPSRTVEEIAVERAAEITAMSQAAARGENYVPAERSSTFGVDEALFYTALGFGFLGFAIGALGLSMGGDKRSNGVAIAVGGSAIATQSLMLILAVVVVSLLVAAILNGLDVF